MGGLQRFEVSLDEPGEDGAGPGLDPLVDAVAAELEHGVLPADRQDERRRELVRGAQTKCRVLMHERTGKAGSAKSVSASAAR